MEPFDSLKLNALKSWKKFCWIAAACCTPFYIWGIYYVLVDADWFIEKLILLSPLILLLIHNISLTLIYRLLDDREKK